MQKKSATLILQTSLSLQYAFCSFAADKSITDSEFASMDVNSVPSLILGTVILILRIVGVLVFMSGIYKMISARKSGEADDINMAMVKLTIGACFMAFPAIMKALGIITGG